jgi:spoIIIJ-associated protein
MSQEDRPDDITSTENDDREPDHEAFDDPVSEPVVHADGDDGARPRRNQRGRRRRAPSEDVQPSDERTREALDFVTKIVKEMEMDCRVRLRRSKSNEDNDEINIEIDGRDAGRIIGKKGQVLAALQFLTHRVVNRPGLERRHILVDAEGYRSRRDDSLATMARRLGRQAVEQGKIITFEPMNPRDRRVVHLALAKFEGVVTKSDGEGDDRRVQIIPVRR